MSNIYALEPHTNAKVILHTTKGDIEIELWGKEAPRATRNFIQLCMEGYYDNTIFHRIIPNFIVQGGDPTGTGHGGESIYDGEFPDEFHSRLRFNRRGLVGMANTGENDNGSQFFITLDRADELTKKHTLFGRVAGDTLFNVMKMTELEVDDDNRPLYPPKIKTTEVVINPFDDIVPRITKKELLIAQQRERQKLEESKPKKVKKEKKKLNLLSFGEEAEELSPESTKATKTKMKSSYDFLDESTDTTSIPLEQKDILEKQSIDPEPIPSSATEHKSTLKDNHESNTKNKKSDQNIIQKPPKSTTTLKTLTAKEEIEKLKNDIKKISSRQDDDENENQNNENQKKISYLQQEREKYQKRGKILVGGLKARKRGRNNDDDETFSKLMAFQNKLLSTEESTPLQKKELPPCKLHDIPGCESCHDLVDDEFEEEQNPNAWMAHRLVFEKDKKGKDLMQRRETVDDYVVIDPREREAKSKQEEYERNYNSKSNSNKDKQDHRQQQRRYNEDEDTSDRKRYSSSSSRKDRDRDYDRRSNRNRKRSVERDDNYKRDDKKRSRGSDDRHYSRKH
ncbi:hypothetical protein BJ944DRAFT_261450 [Cunninghamella echinulata]|nr:hypothetical protein BJ944DRAFT_261450 [Cunninghamella echinulata]